ncbi:MAG: hypothetical protein ONB46_16385 [candidate division KSB1 bacterium]|nr:hypothetical protein [candidate division KSB1 bacterium]MDZ7367264.1 hypothetical protein [candidate division KSB1 bacterium]MDZ7405897.1 hypothetical protein [candidate division KSB1 bacterium]
MEIILKLAVSSYVISLTCMFFLIIRAWVVTSLVERGEVLTFSESEAGMNWLRMVLLSTGSSLVWTIIGAGLYHLLESHALFMQVSLLIVLAVAAILIFGKAAYKVDKIALSAIVILGQGCLIRYMF